MKILLIYTGELSNMKILFQVFFRDFASRFRTNYLKIHTCLHISYIHTYIYKNKDSIHTYRKHSTHDCIWPKIFKCINLATIKAWKSCIGYIWHHHYWLQESKESYSKNLVGTGINTTMHASLNQCSNCSWCLSQKH